MKKEDSIPLFIVVPKSIVGKIIGRRGNDIKQLATSSRTKIHIGNNKSGISYEDSVVEVHGSAEGCAEVAVRYYKKSTQNLELLVITTYIMESIQSLR